MTQRGAGKPMSETPILIVPYMWIGDFVRCHTVVKLLKQRFPSAAIDILTTSMVAPLLDYMPGVRKGVVADLPRKRLALSDQRLAVPFRPQPLSECAMVAQGETLARQVSDDTLAHAGHVVEQRCDHRGRQDIDRGTWKSLFQQLNDGMAANEVANPHVRDNENR